MESNKSVTAVEWFFKWFNDNPEATHKEYAEAFEQAKAMEKDQEERAYKRGQKHKKPLKDSNPINKHFKSE